MSVDLSQFIGEFLQESFEGLDLMESSLLDFVGDAEQIDSVFRAAHSIKGGAGTFGFSEIATFTHGVEAILDEMRSDSSVANAQVIDLLLESVDVLRSMLQATQDLAVVDQQLVSKVAQKIQQVLDQYAISVDVDAVAQQLAANTSEEIDEVEESHCWSIAFKPFSELLKTGNEPLYIFEALAELGEIQVDANLHALINNDDYDPENVYIHWSVTLKANEVQTVVKREDIEEVFEWVEDLCELTISDISSIIEPQKEAELISIKSSEQVSSAIETTANDSLEKNNSLNSKQKLPTELSSVRVDTEKLDELMNRVGELVVTQSMLAQVLREFQKAGYQDQNLEQGVLQLEGNTRDLQEGVMRMRMLPISFVFNRFARLVHDTCSKLSKKAKLEISGDQTEIDKTVMEKIGDPLTHLIRNALDHGLEIPSERIGNGKAEEGKIKLSAYHQNGFVVIDIEDDGRGLDLDKIKNKALSKGVISSEQVLTDEEIQLLIFKPGFSTADELSELSGRGVGMDVVQRNIESLGGQVSVTSTAGKGTSFSVKVPLTLAIIEGQLIYVGDDVYVFPLVSIAETVFIKKTEIRSLGAYSHFMNYRDEYIHLIELNAVFNSKSADIHLNSLLDSEQDGLLVVVTEASGKKVGLVIDQLAGQQQFVVKPLEANFRKVQGLVGGTILGDGSVALILDTAGLITRDEFRNKTVPVHNDRVAAKYLN